MIEVFEGRLGGGKTYSAVLRMVDAWVSGATVCTNVSVLWDNVKKYVLEVFGLILDDRQFIFLDDDKIGMFHRFTPRNCLVVLDEAHLWFNARDWSQSNRELLAFLTQSRKYGTDIIFISQAASNLDKQFMRLIQYVWRFRDMSKWRIPGLGMNWPFQQIMAVRLDYDGKTVLDKKLHWKSKQIFKLYDTNAVYKEAFQRLELDVRGKPVKVRKSQFVKLKEWWKGLTRMKAALVLFVLVAALGALCFGGYKVWTGRKSGLNGVMGIPALSGGSPVSSKSATNAVTLSGVPEALRVSGVVQIGNMVSVVIGDDVVDVGGNFRGFQLLGVEGRSAIFRKDGKLFPVNVGSALP